VRSWLSCDCGEVQAPVSWPKAPFRAFSLVSTSASHDFWREREGRNSGHAGYHYHVLIYLYIYINILTNILFIVWQHYFWFLSSHEWPPKKTKVSNPFEWMETISLQGKTNFFKKSISEYTKSGVRMKETTLECHTIHFNDNVDS
jgi:hypothetical protein